MPTTNFGWDTPTIGGDNNAWGGVLNDMFEQMDTDVQAIKVTADAATPNALPLAGGTLTGQLVLDPVDGHSLGTPVSVVPSAGVAALDLNAGRVFDVGTVTGTALSLNFTNRPVGGLHPVIVIGRYTRANSTEATTGTSDLGCDVTIDSGDLSYCYYGTVPEARVTAKSFPLSGNHTQQPFVGYRAFAVWVRGS